jgi:hypothetical protein
MSYTEAMTILSQALKLQTISSSTHSLLVRTVQNPPLPLQVQLLYDLETVNRAERMKHTKRVTTST